MIKPPRYKNRPGPTQDLINALASGPLHRDALAKATGLLVGEVTQKLYQRMAHVGDVHRIGAMWYPGAAPAGLRAIRRAPSTEDTQAAQAAQRQQEQAVRDRAARDIVCEKATSRTWRPEGTYAPPPMVIRPGALDYQATPTRVGDQRLPYRGSVNLSTGAKAAGPRSGVK